MKIKSILNYPYYTEFLEELTKKKLIIFGTGKSAENLYYQHLKDLPICYAVDNNIERQNQVFLNNIPIKSPDCLKEDIDNVVIIIASSCVNEIAEQLENMGFKSCYNKLSHWLYSFNDIKEIYSNISTIVPEILYLEISSACDLKCIYCQYHSEFLKGEKVSNKVMTLDTFNILLQQLKPLKNINKAILTGNGEPFLNKNWFEIMDKLSKETSIKEISISTNGMLLTKENIRKLSELKFNLIDLCISIDGDSEEENDKYRVGSNYNLIKQNVKFAIEYLPANFKIGIRNCYMPYNEDSIISNTYREELPVPKFLEDDFVGINKASYTVAYTLGNFVEFEKLGFVKKRIKSSTNYICAHLFRLISIDCEGNVTKCACMDAATEAVGSILNQNLVEIFNNYLFKSWRKNLLNGKMPEFCLGCPSNFDGTYEILVKKNNNEYPSGIC